MGKQKYRNKVTSGENCHIYGIWNKMRYRCYNKDNPRYADYGGRGIVICDEWLSDFDNFADWSHENGYQIGLTIDRIDNDGDYSPSNCRWISKKEQNRNKRGTIVVEYKGISKPLVDWCDELCLPYDAIHNRIFSIGMSAEEAFEKKFANQEKSFSAICKEHGMNPVTVRDRIEKFGWSMEEALNTPAMKVGQNGFRTGNRVFYGECVVCGKTFQKNNGKQKYCGQSCHKKSKSVAYKRAIANT